LAECLITWTEPDLPLNTESGRRPRRAIEPMEWRVLRSQQKYFYLEQLKFEDKILAGAQCIRGEIK
jgi:hypothetical protein